MAMHHGRRLIGLVLTMAGVSLTGTAMANPYDISLRGLGRPASASLSDPAVQRYRLLSTELATAMMPKPVQPAETLGMSGFEFSFMNSFTDIHQKAPYWQGQPGSPVLEGVLPSHGARQVPDMLWTPTLHLRKGLPLSSEVGGIGNGGLDRFRRTGRTGRRHAALQVTDGRGQRIGDIMR